MTFIPTYPDFPVLNDAVDKCRRLAAISNNFQYTNAQVIKRMTSFYLYDLPEKFRSLKLKDIYTFTTNAGQDTYPFNSELYTTVDMPCYCAKREIKLFTDPWNFYGVNYNWQQLNNFTTGNGTTGAETDVIISATNADPAVFTVNSTSNLVTGETVIVNNLAGGTWDTINGNTYTITVINATSFSIDVDSSALGAYTASTGSYYTSPYNGFTIGSPLVASVNNDPGTEDNPSLYFPMGRVQNILISANVGFGNTQNVTDDGQGNLIQIFQTSNSTNQEYGWTYYRQYASATPDTPGNATINYETGEIVGLTFAEAIPAGTPIQIAYNSVVQSVPLSIMFYQNQFTLRPVPDKGYTIELTCYRQPIKALIAASMTGNPELSEWWEILAVGGAKKFYEEHLDPDGIMLMDKMLKERYDIIETRTAAQIGQQRIRTIYTDQLTYNYGTGYPGGFGVI